MSYERYGVLEQFEDRISILGAGGAPVSVSTGYVVVDRQRNNAPVFNSKSSYRHISERYCDMLNREHQRWLTDQVYAERTAPRRSA